MKKLLYQDSLVDIYEDSITLKKYYFPSLSPKVIPFRSIEIIEVRKPTLWLGKWRIQGTGNLQTWYPFDPLRPKRDKIFFIRYKNKWIQSGFTVEDSSKVESILKDKSLISR